MQFSESQKDIIKRMRSGQPLTRSKTSGQFWIDTYDMVKKPSVDGLIIYGLIEEDPHSEDSYSVFYKLTPEGATMPI